MKFQKPDGESARIYMFLNPIEWPSFLLIAVSRQSLNGYHYFYYYYYYYYYIFNVVVITLR